LKEKEIFIFTNTQNPFFYQSSNEKENEKKD